MKNYRIKQKYAHLKTKYRFFNWLEGLGARENMLLTLDAEWELFYMFNIWFPVVTSNKSIVTNGAYTIIKDNIKIPK